MIHSVVLNTFSVIIHSRNKYCKGQLVEINQLNQTNTASVNSDFSSKQNSEDTLKIHGIASALKKPILAQNVEKNEEKLALNLERKLKLRWVLAISSLPLFGIYAAFGIAPQTLTNTAPTTMVVEEIILPVVEDATAYSQTFWYKEHVRSDDTLNNLLSRLNVRNRDDIDYIRNNPVAKEITRSLKSGRSVEAQTDIEGNLISLEYQLAMGEFISIKQTAGGLETSKVTHSLDNRPILKSAEIKSSLFDAADDANIPNDVAGQIAEIFESEIDFHTGLQHGDQFKVIYEGHYDQGDLIKTGDVLAAEFVNNGKTYRAVGYRDANNEMHYYTPEGKSLHKSFLRSPLEFTRISSGFSLGRFHPILQRMKAHNGVDLSAPTGTRIRASGDAVVEFVGQKSGYGNVIVLKHDNGVSTVYGHLSRFADGLHSGSKIAQGAIIGFVGMTGLATGPHLHYEFLQNGEHRDPMTVALPNASPLLANHQAEFNAKSNQLMTQLRLMANSNIAALD